MQRLPFPLCRSACKSKSNTYLSIDPQPSLHTQRTQTPILKPRTNSINNTNLIEMIGGVDAAIQTNIGKRDAGFYTLNKKHNGEENSLKEQQQRMNAMLEIVEGKTSESTREPRTPEVIEQALHLLHQMPRERNHHHPPGNNMLVWPSNPPRFSNERSGCRNLNFTVSCQDPSCNSTIVAKNLSHLTAKDVSLLVSHTFYINCSLSRLALCSLLRY